MRLDDFDYSYPEELVATHPLKKRDASRMMVLEKSYGKIANSFVRDLPKFLKAEDVVVINDTKVFPARLVGRKSTGGAFEILLLGLVEKNNPKIWRCIGNQTKISRPGLKIIFGEEISGTILSREGEELIIELDKPELIESVGFLPIPPYIRSVRRAKEKHEYVDEDNDRYQTIYAEKIGSAAAPTAGLHLTKNLMKDIENVGTKIVNVTLHVGLDTFSPVRVENVLEHKMHGEKFDIPEKTIKAIEHAKSAGGRIIAVGTTTVRALESFFSGKKDSTDLFIYPGYKFKIVDAILTNFHQPKSTLLMMVSAFAGKENIMKAYDEAIKQKYRLFSFGDCMLMI